MRAKNQDALFQQAMEDHLVQALGHTFAKPALGDGNMVASLQNLMELRSTYAYTLARILTILGRLLQRSQEECGTVTKEAEQE